MIFFKGNLFQEKWSLRDIFLAVIWAMSNLVLTTEEYLSYVAIKLKMWGLRGMNIVCAPVCACASPAVVGGEVIGAIALLEVGNTVGF